MSLHPAALAAMARHHTQACVEGAGRLPHGAFICGWLIPPEEASRRSARVVVFEVTPS